MQEVKKGYLALSRKLGEAVSLTTEAGERIEVTIGAVQGNKVRLLLLAPKSVRIVRTEIEAAYLERLATERAAEQTKAG